VLATAEAVPALQRLAVGVTLVTVPFAGPHVPLIVPAGAVVHCAVVPPLVPAQLHVHGPLPLTEDARPVAHRLAAGALVAPDPLADPQVPLISSWAEQDAVVPPLLPAQDQVHGPLPLTDDAVLPRCRDSLTASW
jgi:hypothetical protein